MSFRPITIEGKALSAAIEETDNYPLETRLVIKGILGHPSFPEWISLSGITPETSQHTLEYFVQRDVQLRDQIRRDVENNLSLEVHADDFRTAFAFYMKLPRG